MSAVRIRRGLLQAAVGEALIQAHYEGRLLKSSSPLSHQPSPVRFCEREKNRLSAR